MPGKSTHQGRWGLRSIILLSLLPLFLLAAGAGVVFNYSSAQESTATLLEDYFQQRRLELKFVANLPTLKTFIIDLRLGLTEEASFFRQELISALEHHFSETASAFNHDFSIVSPTGETLLHIKNSKVVSEYDQIPTEFIRKIQEDPANIDKDLPSLTASAQQGKPVTDFWPLVDPIHNEAIGGLIYTYEVPVDDITAKSRKILWFNVFFNIANLFLLFGLLYLIINYLTSPLQRLTHAIRQIMKGDLSQAVPPAGYGEALTLSQSFEEMRQRLQESFSEIHRSNKELAELLETQQKISRELALSKKRFEQLAEQSRTIVWEVDRAGMFVSVSPVVFTVLGYHPSELVGKMHYYDLYDTTEQQSAKDLFFQFFSGENAQANCEVSLLSKDGDRVWLNSRRMTLYHEDGKISGYYGSDTDVSERKRAEKENEQLQLQLLHAQKMEAIGTMAGGVAHDFNNLLQVINGSAQIMQSQKSRENPDYEGLSRICSAGERAAGLVRQLLTFSRKMKSDYRLLDLNYEVTYTAQMWQQSLPKMIDTTVTLDDDLWLINGDPSQIQQVLLNLATNAADAMPDGGTFSITTENIILDDTYCWENGEATPGKHVLLKISDGGMGMSQETIEHIFEPFFTTKEVGKGTGLGLASTYGIVAGHNGHIRCESEQGKGTTFFIYLPAATEDEKAEHEDLSSVQTLEGSETLLFIDDEEMIQDMTHDFFTTLGYIILKAASGEEALDILAKKNKTIDLAILDMNMPGMGGHKCLLAIRKVYTDLPVLIASGYSDHGPVQNTLNLGAQGYIGKPFTMEKLAEKVRTILDKPKKPSNYS